MGTTRVWRCPADGEELSARSGNGWVHWHCEKCKRFFTANGSPLFANRERAIETFENR